MSVSRNVSVSRIVGLVLLVVGATVIVNTGTAEAVEIPLFNGGFEEPPGTLPGRPIEGWYVLTGYGPERHAITHAPAADEPIQPTEGSQVAKIWGKPEGTAVRIPWSDWPEEITGNETLIVTFDIGNPRTLGGSPVRVEGYLFAGWGSPSPMGDSFLIEDATGILNGVWLRDQTFSLDLSGLTEHQRSGGLYVAFKVTTPYDADDYHFVYIDNVRLTAVPEPSSIVAAGSALFALSAMCWLRKHRGRPASSRDIPVQAAKRLKPGA